MCMTSGTLLGQVSWVHASFYSGRVLNGLEFYLSGSRSILSGMLDHLVWTPTLCI